MFLNLSIDNPSCSIDVAALGYKLFWSTYINMAILIILASGYVHLTTSSTSSTTQSFVNDLHILQGSFYDFTSDWYGNVGTYFLTSYILEAGVPIAYDLFQYFLIYPAIRWWHFPYIRQRISHVIVRQHDLNKLLVGEPFDSTIHQIQLLAVFFFAQTYAGGLPLMIPFCAITFIIYFLVDKLLLLRHNQKPPHVGSATIQIVQSLLPYAVMIRIAVSCWMFSASGTVISYVAENNTYTNSSRRSTLVGVSYYSMLSSLKNRITHNSPILNNIAYRVCSPQVFPLIILFFVIIGVKVVLEFYQSGLFAFISSWMAFLYRCCYSSHKKANPSQVLDEQTALQFDIVTLYDIAKRDDPLRQEVAPFTREYFKYVLPSMTVIPHEINCCQKNSQVRDLLTKHDMKRGWNITERNGLMMKVKRWQVNHVDPNESLEGSHPDRTGDLKFTYEIIEEYGCNSYALDRIPAYVTIIQGIVQAAAALRRKRQQDMEREYQQQLANETNDELDQVIRYEDIYKQPR